MSNFFHWSYIKLKMISFFHNANNSWIYFMTLLSFRYVRNLFWAFNGLCSVFCCWNCQFSISNFFRWPYFKLKVIYFFHHANDSWNCLGTFRSPSNTHQSTSSESKYLTETVSSFCSSQGNRMISTSKQTQRTTVCFRTDTDRQTGGQTIRSNGAGLFRSISAWLCRGEEEELLLLISLQGELIKLQITRCENSGKF